MKPRALDLFCCAGVASMGLHRAGFDVVGVDIEPQPHYPFEFHQADALAFPLDGFDFIWASPPCQAHSSLRHVTGKTYLDLIPATRARLVTSGIFYVIENVPGAPLRNPIMLCGSRFGLQVRRHRLFESNFLGTPGGAMKTGCDHARQGRPIDVSGTGGRRRNDRKDGRAASGNSNKPRSLAEAQAAIGISWMPRAKIAQAIPPAYAEYIGRAALEHIAAIRQAAE